MKFLPLLLLPLLLLLSTFQAHANDNTLAHKLFEEEKFAQAAEIFTDPAWKGVALYKSGQWWRAAEAFVRADDADSQFNLGNCYVKLTYYALALEAYQRALSMDPSHEDAQFNYDLMLALLAEQNNDEEEASALLQPKELERIESENEGESGSASGGEEDDNTSDATQEQRDTEGTEPTQESTSEQAQQGETGDSSDSSEQNQENQGTSEVSGINDEHNEQANASGKSDSDSSTNDSQAAGLRNTLEAEQATEQWLNQIQHDPYRFLTQRIELEMQRRIASGQAPPEGGSSW